MFHATYRAMQKYFNAIITVVNWLSPYNLFILKNEVFEV